MATKHDWVVVTRRSEDGTRYFVQTPGTVDDETSSLDEAHGWHYKRDAVAESDRLGFVRTHVGRRSVFEKV